MVAQKLEVAGHWRRASARWLREWLLWCVELLGSSIAYWHCRISSTLTSSCL
ncbi:hypothetical protein ACEOWF_004888 [Escherichia coli]|nr:hypothetical protein [Escherichia coli]EGN0942021.1 hypothetical protein [Escherichia coli]EIK7911780.1 hypothetical protein [Escherichia coli]EJK7323962.1 hypothetical protein [Escherichia coli]ELI5581217.1 hypothetical protein [Escherichia coli]